MQCTAVNKSLPSVDTSTLDVAKLYEEAPPAFGHDMLKLFGFAPGYVNLNHGSFGSVSLPVRAVCDKLADEVESNPDKFMRISVLTYLTRVRERVAKLIGADTDECVLVNNTSHGMATVMRNFIFNQGDVLVGGDHHVSTGYSTANQFLLATTTYASVSKTLKYLADIPPYPTLSAFNLQFPTTHAKIIEDFRAHIKGVTEATDVAGGRKIVAVIDSIVSLPGVLLPWKEMVAICREAGVISVVDAAHSIGQELDINLSEARPDFWVSVGAPGALSLSLLMNPAPKELPQMAAFKEGIRRSLCSKEVPSSLSTSIVRKTSFITLTFVSERRAALDFREWLGGEHKINEYSHNLAIAGGKRLAKRLGTSVMDPEGDLTLNMVNVGLPIPGEIESSDEILRILQETLLLEWNCFVSPFRHNGKWWTRCCAQVWNEISDFDVIADALEDACARVVDFAKQQAN
ncbi:pyridoxal phosphate-dependent transferase [Melanogaster broomeanus]|nr:pyridoxal phosphate-dependent transferase [Melanogaster broomeanus]